ncbi:hypothetical protein [Methylorubrum thiocyanatum]|uniref:hypothetical protein n=1 Tax=Methylorubrum thiocyanatum TaxID=47958 RepID=UPI003F7F7EDF
MTDASLEQVRKIAFEGVDRTLFLHLGHFYAWFAQVELNITQILAMSLNQQDHEAFELLVQGMDLRVKLQRLRKACKKDDRLGPNMKSRILYLEEKIIPLRNKLSHCAVHKDDNQDLFYIASIGRMPWEAIAGLPQVGERPEEISGLRLFEAGYWLCQFMDDTTQAIKDSFSRKILK